MRLDFLILPEIPDKGAKLTVSVLEGAALAGHDSIIVRRGPVREDSTLVVYGPGGKARFGYVSRHLEAGRRVIAFDLGYWHRDDSAGNRHYRVSINGLHSPQYIMRGPRPGSARWDAAGLRAGNVADPSGPIVLVGNGPKSNAVGASGWTAAKSIELRERFPGRAIWYRPKPERERESGVLCDAVVTGQPIDAVLTGASLVVCRHSNVAVDACRLGVPAVCDDGAAAAIYPNTFDGAQPDEATRLEFLHRLAWWQWSPKECRSGEFWPWMEQVLHAAV